MSAASRSERTDDLELQIGHIIRIQRRIRGMSQQELSRRLGVTFQQVQKYEKGKSRIAASRLYDIARVMDLPVETFFDGLSADQCSRDAVYDILERFRVLAPQFGFHEFMDLNRAFVGIRNRAIQTALLRLINEIAGTAHTSLAEQEAEDTAVEEEIAQPLPRRAATLPGGPHHRQGGGPMHHSLMASCADGETVG